MWPTQFEAIFGVGYYYKSPCKMEPSKCRLKPGVKVAYTSRLSTWVYTLAYSLVLKNFKELVLMYNYGSQKHETVKKIGQRTAGSFMKINGFFKKVF